MVFQTYNPWFTLLLLRHLYQCAQEISILAIITLVQVFVLFTALWHQLLGLTRLGLFLEFRRKLWPVQLPGSSNCREQFVWRSPGVQTVAERLCPVQVVYMRKGGQNQFLQTYNYRHYANFKKLLKLRTAIVLIDWTIRIHKCGCFYWTQVRKIQLPCVLSCSSDSFWSESLGEVLSCPTSG